MAALVSSFIFIFNQNIHPRLVGFNIFYHLRILAFHLYSANHQPHHINLIQIEIVDIIYAVYKCH